MSIISATTAIKFYPPHANCVSMRASMLLHPLVWWQPKPQTSSLDTGSSTSRVNIKINTCWKIWASGWVKYSVSLCSPRWKPSVSLWLRSPELYCHYMLILLLKQNFLDRTADYACWWHYLQKRSMLIIINPRLHPYLN